MPQLEHLGPIQIKDKDMEVAEHTCARHFPQLLFQETPRNWEEEPPGARFMGRFLLAPGRSGAGRELDLFSCFGTAGGAVSASAETLPWGNGPRFWEAAWAYSIEFRLLLGSGSQLGSVSGMMTLLALVLRGCKLRYLITPVAHKPLTFSRSTSLISVLQGRRLEIHMLPGKYR